MSTTAEQGDSGAAERRSEQTEELAFAGLARQAELVAAGEVGSRELVELSLERIEATQDTVRAFRRVRAEAALAEADEADRRVAAGERLPLLGVPVAIKDDMDLAGETTPFGCEGEFEPKADDGEVAQRLRAAGAVIVGKTSTCEVGQWPITESPAFGVTRNPWSLDHTPGGSSGGSAAAVAAGLVAAAVGSDGAGSVRIPAAWTHLVGIKPQRGRVSTWPDPEAFNGITCIGPLTRNVDDAALMLDVLSGNRPGDAHRPPPPVEPFAATARRGGRRAGPLDGHPRGAPATAGDGAGGPGQPAPGRLRIALSTRMPFVPVPKRLHPEIRAALERIGTMLERLGHHVEPADPFYGVVGGSFMPRSTGGVADWIERVPDPTRLDPRTHGTARMGRLLRPLLGLARRLERPAQWQIGRIFRRFDVVLAPTTAQPPLPIGSIDGLGGWETDKVIAGACPYAWPWNVVGWPGVNVPAGLTADGLPIGAQLLGPANSEPALVGLAAQLEAEESWHRLRPPS